MVQNPPYWMKKECSRFEHKGIPNSFKLDFPLFSMSHWGMPRFFALQYGGFLPCDPFVQKAHSFCNQSNYVDAVPESKVAQSHLRVRREVFCNHSPRCSVGFLKINFFARAITDRSFGVRFIEFRKNRESTTTSGSRTQETVP